MTGDGAGPVLYGIPNCDTIRKARAWLKDAGVACRFHDYRRNGVPLERLDAWVVRLGWQALLNRAGTTFRRLPEEQRSDLDATRAVALMRAHPAAIRRPVLEAGETLLVGFDPARYQAAQLTREGERSW